MSSKVDTMTSSRDSYSNKQRDVEKEAEAFDDGLSPEDVKAPTHYEVPPTVDMKKLMWKIDSRLLPPICILYVLAFLDRINISNASVYGLQTDLHLTPLQYNTCLVIFFVPYVVFEIPSNLIVKRLKPHVWLPLCMFFFGLMSTVQGLVHNYGGLLVTRFLLGAFEAGMFPGCFYLMAMWYKREESQKRYSFFFSSTSLAGAFGGLLASGIGNMDGIRNFRGWRWVFIIEGIATCLFALSCYFWIPDFPEDSTFLSADELRVVKLRLKEDVGGSARHEGIKPRDVLAVFKDYKVILAGFMYLGMVVSAYGYAYPAPTIIKNFGYGTTETQLRSVPPWVCAFGLAMILAFLSDRLKHRWLFSVFASLVALTGFVMLLTIHDNIHAEYAALFLAVMGTYSALPLLICWFSTNVAGHHRRSVGSAWQIGFGNIGGIIASYSFPSSDGPRYTKGNAICIAFIVLSIVASTCYGFGLIFENRRRERLKREKGEEGEWEEKKGDLNVGYRYIF